MERAIRRGSHAGCPCTRDAILASSEGHGYTTMHSFRMSVSMVTRSCMTGLQSMKSNEGPISERAISDGELDQPDHLSPETHFLRKSKTVSDMPCGEGTWAVLVCLSDDQWPYGPEIHRQTPSRWGGCTGCSRSFRRICAATDPGAGLPGNQGTRRK